MLLRNIKRFCQTFRCQIGCADCTDFTGLDQLLIGAENIFKRRFGIIPVRLVKIDIVGLQPFEGGIDGFADIAW